MSDSVDEAVVALEEYLRRYPSGNFAELAQARLDRLLAQRGENRLIVDASNANPYTRGTALANTDYRVGDRYEFRVIDLQSGREFNRTHVVASVSAVEVAYNDGKVVLDVLGNTLQGADGRRYADNQTFPAEYTVGKKWTTRYRIDDRRGSDEISIDYTVAGREHIEVPAGRFDAFRVEGSGMSRGYQATGWSVQGGRKVVRYWIAPNIVRRCVLIERRSWDGRGVPDRAERVELMAFKETR